MGSVLKVGSLPLCVNFDWLRKAIAPIILSLSLWKTSQFLWKTANVCGKLWVSLESFLLKANVIGLVIWWLNVNHNSNGTEAFF